MLGRNDRGFGGRDIRVYEPGSLSLGVHDLYTRFIPNTREYRIHVFRDEVIRVQGKYLDYPEQHTNPYIKNYAQGFRFRAPNLAPHQRRLDDAVAAVDAIGLDFGAVDLIIGEDGEHYILEINTAPACSPLTARQYVTKFAEILGIEPDWSMLDGQMGEVRLDPPRRLSDRRTAPTQPAWAGLSVV